MFKSIYRALIVVGVFCASALAQQSYVTAIVPDGVQNWAGTSTGAVFYVGSATATGCPISTSTITSDRAGATTISQTNGVSIPYGAKTVSFYVAPNTYTIQWKVPSNAGSQCFSQTFTAGADPTILPAGSFNIVDGTDNTKKLNFTASGNTTAITETIAAAANVAATVTLPNATGTIPVTLGTYQGTSSVGITDTNFHALIAAASDVKVPANTLNAAGKKIRVHGSGVYTNAAASLLNARVDLCTVSGCATGTDFAAAGCAVVTTNQANNLSNGQFSIDCTFTATSTLGASGTAMAKALVCANLGAAVTAVQSCFQDQATAVSATFDETVDEFVNISFKFSSSNAGNSATLHEMDVQLVK